MNTAFRLSLVMLAISLASTGCTSKEPPVPKELSENTPTPAATPANTAPEVIRKGNDLTVKTTDTALSEANQAAVDKLNSIPSILELVKKNSIPTSTIICTVGGDTVNVEKYKSELRKKQEQIQAVLQSNPDQRKPLLELAKQQNIALTPEERKGMIDQGKKALGKDMDKLLKQNKLTQQQFEDQLSEMGLALKAGSRAVEKQLMTELINRALLISEARDAGLSKAAFNRYVEFKSSPQYAQALKVTNLTEEQLKEKALEQFLAEAMQKKLVAGAELPDSKVLELYNEKKEQLKHKGRIKWSQIVVAAPEMDMGGVESLKSQIHRQYPKLTGADFNNSVQKTELAQRKKAFDLLKSIRSGKKFEEVANTSTDDIPARAAKKGGDMGYVAIEDLKKNQLLSKVGEALEKMKVGQISEEPVRTIFGWHIVKKTDDQKPGYIPFAEVKDQLKQALAQQQATLAVGAWMIEKRQSVPIAISKDFEKYIAGSTVSAPAPTGASMAAPQGTQATPAPSTPTSGTAAAPASAAAPAPVKQ